MSLRTLLLATALALAALLLAGLLAMWQMARSFERSIAAQEAAIRATPASGAARTDLPLLLRSFLARTQARDPERVRWTRIEQRGAMRLSPDGPWLPFTAVQHFAVSQPGMVWRAEMRMSGGIWADVVDSLVHGQGRLEARLLGALPLARAGGPGAVQGQLQRLLAELPWAPAAIAANSTLSWQALDARRVQVSATVGDVTARVVLRFDDAGDVVEATATDRPRMLEGRNVPTPFGGALSDYRVLNGLRIPTRARVWWDLPSGRFEYWRGEVTAVAWE
jgi:hypothetical protein